MIARSLLSWILGLGILLAAPAAAGAQTRKEFKLPDSAVKFSPIPYVAPAVYEQWWREVAACEKLPLPAKHFQVRWMQLNARKFYDVDRPQFGRDAFGNPMILWAVAMTYLRDLEVYVALPYLLQPIIIKHEMVHLLMSWAGEKRGHPPERFEVCGLTTEYYGP